MKQAAESLGNNQVRSGNFPWSCKISTPDGKFYFIEDDDFLTKIFGIFDVPMIAEKSFQSKGFDNTININIGFSGRKSMVNGKLKIIINSGQSYQHGNISVEIVDGLLNITGSKSLEIDPSRIENKSLSILSP